MRYQGYFLKIALGTKVSYYHIYKEKTVKLLLYHSFHGGHMPQEK